MGIAPKLLRQARGLRSPVLLVLLLAATSIMVCSLRWHVSSVRVSMSLCSSSSSSTQVVTDSNDIDHRGRVGAACEGLNRTRLTLNASDSRLVAPVVVLSHARPGYLGRTLLTLHKHWSEDAANRARFPLFVSVDGTDPAVLLLATSLRFATGLQVIQTVREPSRCNGPGDGYCWLSHHYRMLLQLFFECLKAPRLIFVEEDLAVAPDFFSYFAATPPLMQRDPSILCVSAWNDHGQQGRVANHTALYRTDIMPGLGWMLSAAVGLEALPGWPGAGWDEYMRDQRFVKGRQCIFPEVARTHTFGEKGASGGIGYREHLANMVLNQQRVDWASMDLSYLTKARYAQHMQSWLAGAVPLSAAAPAAAPDDDGDAAVKKQLSSFCAADQPPDKEDSRDMLVTYRDNEHFSQLALQLGPMMWDISYGGKVPRASYNGTVIVRCRGRRLFITKQ